MSCSYPKCTVRYHITTSAQSDIILYKILKNVVLCIYMCLPMTSLIRLLTDNSVY